jgi:hypothetical protein
LVIKDQYTIKETQTYTTNTYIQQTDIIQPPVEQPPVEQPTVEQPPVEQPPVEQPTVEQLLTPLVKDLSNTINIIKKNITLKPSKNLKQNALPNKYRKKQPRK